MTRITKKRDGQTTDVDLPSNFAGAGFKKTPIGSQTVRRFRRGKTWASLLSGVASVYTTYAFAADFSKGEYWRNGTQYGASEGPELLPNGTFETADGWALPADWQVIDGQLAKTGTASATAVTYLLPAPLVAGAAYKVEFDVTAISGSVQPAFRVGGSGALAYSNEGVAASVGRHTRTFVTTAAQDTLRFQVSSAAQTVTLDNVSVKMVAGPWALPGYTFTRTGEQGAVDSTGAVSYFPANVPAINDRGYHAYGALTNLLLNAGSSSGLSTQSATVTAAAHTISFIGTGSVTLSGAATGTLNGTGANNRVALVFTPSAGSLTVTVSGSVTYAVLIAGNYPDGGPIIRTAGATASIGVSALETSFSLANEDQLIVCAFNPPAFKQSRFLYQIWQDGNNQVYLRTQDNAHQLVVIVGGSVAHSVSVGVAAGGRTVVGVRRKGGKWSIASLRAGSFAISAETTAAIPSSVTKVLIGANGSAECPLELLTKQVGTFSDAEVQAILETA